jgi:aryl-alcohol dehydrogenase
MRVTAAVVEEVHAPFRVEELEIDEPRRGEALVRIAATGVCHTDAIARDGDLPYAFPGVLGHEGAGTVVAVGEDVTSVAEGDHVVIGWPWCGVCRNCREGQQRYCAQIGPLIGRGTRADGSSALRRLDGSLMHGHFFGQSSFATHAMAEAHTLVKMPRELPLDRVGPLACGLATGAGAVFNVLQPRVGSSVVVYGAGAVGLAAIMAARNSGATTIIAVDRHPGRLRLAAELGATDTIDVGHDDPVAAVHEICGGGPADYSLECTGNVDVVRQAADSVGMRGTCVLIGGAPAGAELSLDHLTTLWGKRVVGILGGEGTSERLIGALAQLHLDGRFPYDRLIAPFALDEVNDAIEASAAGDVLKPVLRMPA